MSESDKEIVSIPKKMLEDLFKKIKEIKELHQKAEIQLQVKQIQIDVLLNSLMKNTQKDDIELDVLLKDILEGKYKPVEKLDTLEKLRNSLKND